jgi:hypothetical protein
MLGEVGQAVLTVVSQHVYNGPYSWLADGAGFMLPFGLQASFLTHSRNGLGSRVRPFSLAFLHAGSRMPSPSVGTCIVMMCTCWFNACSYGSWTSHSISITR